MLNEYLEPLEQKVLCECDLCCDEIYIGEEYFNIEDNYLHYDCAFDWIEQFRMIAGE